jgi:hypothetical protein
MVHVCELIVWSIIALIGVVSHEIKSKCIYYEQEHFSGLNSQSIIVQWREVNIIRKICLFFIEYNIAQIKCLNKKTAWTDNINKTVILLTLKFDCKPSSRRVRKKPERKLINPIKDNKTEIFWQINMITSIRLTKLSRFNASLYETSCAGSRLGKKTCSEKQGSPLCEESPITLGSQVWTGRAKKITGVLFLQRMKYKLTVIRKDDLFLQVKYAGVSRWSAFVFYARLQVCWIDQIF